MSEDYEAGLRDGRIEALKSIMAAHDDRMDQHERRLLIQERVTYGLLGAVFLIEAMPMLQRVFNA